MGLSTREMLLVIRARDVASRVVREVGTSIASLGDTTKITGQQMMNAGAALTAVGVTLGAAGAIGLSFLNDATDAAIEYNRQAALTKTQVDDVSVSVKDLADIGREVAKDIPAPFDQMQTALYDIFSSMDVGVTQAEDLLRGFSKSAVAGQVDIQTAARSTISILNAYQLPISDLNHVMDVQFQLVRKGVGTYEEFNTSLGRAIPAAVAAGQQFETLAGMMAFLTRNGLSTEMAATSAARAMELFADPDKFKALEELGVTVRDSSGHFLQMNDIVTQLASNQGWAQMAEPARKEMFESIFGQGTIQARRFFDLAIPNFEQLNGLTGSMYDSAGALEGAYGTMFDQPASKAQLLTNQYEILKTEIGEELIPTKIKLMEQVQKLINWWNGLSEGTQDLIIKIALFGSAALLVVGVILAVVGGVAMLIGAIMAMGVSFGAAIAIIAIVPIVIAAVAAAGAALAYSWEGISKVAGSVWSYVKDVASDAWQMMQDFWDWLSGNAVSVWQTVSSAVVTAWNTVYGAVQAVWHWLVGAWQWFVANFGEGFSKIWNTVWKEAGAIFEEVGETISAVIGYVVSIFEWFWGIAEPIIMGFIALWPLAYDAIAFAVSLIVLTFNVLWQTIQMVLDVVIAVVSGFVEFVQIVWANFGDFIIRSIQLTWNFVSSIISSVITIISNVIQLGMNIIQGDWGEAWQNVKNIFGAAWDAIWAALQFVWGFMMNFFTNLGPNIVSFIGDVISLLWDKGWQILQGLWNGLIAIWGFVWGWTAGLPEAIGDFFSDAINWLYESGKDILEGLLSGMKSAWETVATWTGGLGAKIISLKGPPAKDRELLEENGKLIMQGLGKGMQEGWKDVESFLGAASDQITGFGGPESVLTARMGANLFGGAGSNMPTSLTGPSYGFYVENLNVSDENVVNDMNWWYQTTSTGV